jgi:hypothetical protein
MVLLPTPEGPLIMTTLGFVWVMFIVNMNKWGVYAATTDTTRHFVFVP